LNTTQIKEDGDEHLPLVKRARVRIGKQSSLEEEHNNFTQAQEEDQMKLPSMQWRKTITFFNLKKEDLLKLELIHWSRLAPPQIATVILLLIEIR
jgi:hypothetical protein